MNECTFTRMDGAYFCEGLLGCLYCVFCFFFLVAPVVSCGRRAP